MKNGRQLCAIALGIGLAVPASVYATNGMFMIGAGAKATGMGGAGVAYPQDGMAAAYNPALMTEVGESRLDVTVELLRPPRTAVHDSSGSTFGDTDVRSNDDLFPIPAFGAVLSAPGTPFAMGGAIVGAGLGTNYEQPKGTFFWPPQIVPQDKPHDKVGVFLMQMQILPSFALKVDETNSIGASLVIGAQMFRAFGLQAFGPPLFYSQDPESLTDEGFDWSFGLGMRFGWLGSYFDKKLRVGANYSPRVNMQKFDNYRGLFADHGDFDIPTNFTVGLAYKFTPKSTVAFDFERIYWSKIDSIGNPGPLASDPNQFFPLCPTGTDTTPCRAGGSKGLGFGWNDQTVYKLGFDHQWSKTLTLRAGFNYGKAPIPEDQVLFNMLAPATTEKHYTLGATYVLDKDSDLTFSAMHSPKNTIKGPTAFPPSPSTVVEGSNAAISMSQTSIGVAYGMKF